jgi:acetyl esterase/lipase
MLWNDDYHHSAAVVLTGRAEAYYTDYVGAASEFVAAAKWGYLYQGQRYKWQKNRRGQPALDLPPEAFVSFIQNHDQVANSAAGLRCHALAAPGHFRALSALTILMPGTPMLFMGGTSDMNVPLLGGEQMYEALKSLGRPTELVVYPGQFHGFTRPSFIRDRYERWMGWWDKYLKAGTSAPAPPNKQAE